MKASDLSPVGSRILKSAAGVLICGLVYFLRGRSGMPFYSMLAALWCIQPYYELIEQFGDKLKAIPHKDCVWIAPSDFSSDCIEIPQAYWSVGSHSVTS